MKRQFSLGQVVSTPGALEVLEQNQVAPATLLFRHQGGDWGKVDKEDAEANDYAVEHDLRILSAYDVKGKTIWIITEWDRSVTTLLLPDEY